MAGVGDTVERVILKPEVVELESVVVPGEVVGVGVPANGDSIRHHIETYGCGHMIVPINCHSKIKNCEYKRVEIKHCSVVYCDCITVVEGMYEPYP